MANRKRLPPEPPIPPVPGGRSRPSQRVRLARYPEVARRQALNTRLLSSTCAFTPTPTEPLRPAELGLVRRVIEERSSADHAVLRTEAVRELARAPSVAGIEHLVGLATSPVEHDGVRAAAIATLVTAGPRIGAAVLSGLRRDPSRLVQQTVSQLLRGAERPAGGTPARRRARARRRTPASDRYAPRS